MNKKTVGVVIATYNGEKYIEEQLVSIINQTQKPDQIIITDGNSSDDTIKKVKDIISDSDIDFKVLNSVKRLSIRENFQKGIEECSCDFIFLSDQDDSWNVLKVEKTIKYMNQFNASLAFTNAKLVDENLDCTCKNNLWEQIGFKADNSVINYQKNDRPFIDELLHHNVVTGMCLCMTKDLKNIVLPLSKYSLHDSWIALNAIVNGDVVAINDELVFYRQHGTNAVGANKTSLAKKIQKSKDYYTKLENRFLVIKEWIVKNNLEDSYMLEYLKHLSNRMELLAGNTSLISSILILKKYERYEKDSFSIIAKDLCYRFFIKSVMLNRI